MNYYHYFLTNPDTRLAYYFAEARAFDDKNYDLLFIDKAEWAEIVGNHYPDLETRLFDEAMTAFGVIGDINFIVSGDSDEPVVGEVVEDYYFFGSVRDGLFYSKIFSSEAVAWRVNVWKAKQILRAKIIRHLEDGSSITPEMVSKYNSLLSEMMKATF